MPDWNVKTFFRHDEREMLGVSDAVIPDVAAALRCSTSSRCTCATTLDDRCKPLNGAVQQGQTWPSTACPATSRIGHYRESPNIGGGVGFRGAGSAAVARGDVAATGDDGGGNRAPVRGAPAVGQPVGAVTDRIGSRAAFIPSPRPPYPSRARQPGILCGTSRDHASVQSPAGVRGISPAADLSGAALQSGTASRHPPPSAR